MQRANLFFVMLFLSLLAGCEQVVLDPDDPLERPGPYKVKTTAVNFDSTTTGSRINGSLYYPSGTFSTGELPLVVITHGFSLHYYDYEIYSRHLASHGFVVLGFDFVETSADSNIANHDDKAVQLSEAIDYALGPSPLADNINPSLIAAMGHSLGGKIAFLAAADDHRIATVIALDPSNAGGPPCFISPDNCANYPAAPNPSRGQVGVLYKLAASSLIFRSLPDAANPEAEFNARYFYYGDDGNGNNGVPAPAFYINMGSAPHANYMPKITSYVATLAKRNSLAWLQQVFYGTDNSSYFTGVKMQADIAAGRVVGFAQRN